MREFIIGVILFTALVVSTLTAVNLDLTEDRVTKLELATNQLLSDVENSIKTDSKTTDVIEKLYTKSNDLQKAIESLQAENVILKDNLSQLQETVDKLNQTTQNLEPNHLFGDIGIEPQKFTLPNEPAPTVNRQATINKLKKDVRRLEETINLFQFERQHGGIQ